MVSGRSSHKLNLWGSVGAEEERPEIEPQRRSVGTRAWFCGYCGRGGLLVEDRNELERVCSICGFGLVLETSAELAPSPADAFLVVDDALNIEAISHQAEELLGVRERFVVRRPLTDVLAPANHDPHLATKLLEAVGDATSGAAGTRPSHLLLCPIDNPNLRLKARIGRCGPPLSALIVLEPTEAERLHLLFEHH